VFFITTFFLVEVLTDFTKKICWSSRNN